MNRLAVLQSLKNIGALLSFLVFTAIVSAGLVPDNLQCEYQTQPLAIEEPEPLLSWQLQADRRAETQSAYRILAATSPELLAPGKADLWDSGQVISSEQNHIPYAGKKLDSLQSCFWTVGVWDRDQKFGGWSAPASWTMGILKPEDWKASFIELNLPADKIDEKLEWIWYPSPLFAPPGNYYFRKSFDLPEDALSAEVQMSADNRFTLFVNGKEAGRGTAYTKFFKFDILPHLKKGANQLAILAANDGTQNNEAGMIGLFKIKTKNDSTLEIPIHTDWKSSNKEFPGWTSAEFKETDAWVAPVSRGVYGIKPWGKIQLGEDRLPIFQKTFELADSPRRALIHICGLGQYELSLNGKKVGDSVIDPGWTNYRQTCLYSTYDITQELLSGTNTLSVLLGNGMYNVRGGRYIKFTGSFGNPKLICRLQIDHADGTSQVIGTDSSWLTARGPITFSCTYGGEDFDARLENNLLWGPATPTDGPGGVLRAQYAPPIKIMTEYHPQSVTEPKPGIFVMDLGQNFSGFPEISAIGTAGKTIRLWPGEILNPDGTVCQNQSGTPFYFEYTFAKTGEEITWAPRFTYYGFRYVQIEGATAVNLSEKTSPKEEGAVTITGLVGNFTYASADKAGSFSCSNPLINRIDHLIRMAIYSNFQSVFTDCPHREKLGWLEQTHLMANGLIANLSLMRHYTKLMRDCAEAQLPNGLVPDIAPEYTVFSPDFRDSPEWGSAFVLDPWYVWLHYGDSRLAERYYAQMKNYVTYLKNKKDQNGMISHGLGDWYDVGPGPSGYAQLTSKELTATATYYQNLNSMIHFARLFNRQDDLKELTAEAQSIKELFNKRLYNSEKNYYDKNSQTANSMPLVVGLADESLAKPILENLVSIGIRGATNRITAGDVGFSYLVKALLEHDQGQVLFDMVNQTNGPGYWHMLEQGCTSLHESWKAEKSSSFNHFMLGHAEEWFYRGIGGISPSADNPGYQKFILKPQVVGDLSEANVTYQSIRGEILSHWKIENGRFIYHIRVPANTEALVYLPATSSDWETLAEGDTPLKSHPQIQVLNRENVPNAIELKVPSGDYLLSSEYKP